MADQVKIVYRCKACKTYVHEEDLRYGPEVGVRMHYGRIDSRACGPLTSMCGPVVSIGRHRVTAEGKVMEKVRDLGTW